MKRGYVRLNNIYGGVSLVSQSLHDVRCHGGEIQSPTENEGESRQARRDWSEVNKYPTTGCLIINMTVQSVQHSLRGICLPRHTTVRLLVIIIYA